MFKLNIMADRDEIVAALRFEADRIEKHPALWDNAQSGIRPRVYEQSTANAIGWWELS